MFVCFIWLDVVRIFNEDGVIGNWVVVVTVVSFKYYCQVIKLSMEYTQRLKQQPFGGHSEELVHVWEHL